MSELPERIVIGPYHYPVISDEATHIKYEHGAKNMVWGAMQYTEHRILIDPNMNREKKAVTLLHEVMHGCDDLAGNSDLDNEERIICALAPILLDTLRRNPDFVAYLLTASPSALHDATPVAYQYSEAPGWRDLRTNEKTTAE